MINLTVIGLLAYVLLSGLRSTILKALQVQGDMFPIGGQNPISFCNVFLISQTIVGLTLLLRDGKRTRDDLNLLDQPGLADRAD